jgi:hypothetical protein
MLIDYETNKIYTLTTTATDYATASAACANTQPLSRIVTSGTLVCFSLGYSEHLAVESYFRAQNPTLTSYWIGLRQPGLGTNPYSKFNFAWEDSAPAPSLHPSGQDYDGVGYSHWGWINSFLAVEPNNAGATNQQCTMAWSAHLIFSYFSGPETYAARRVATNYVKESNSTRNLWSWNDRPCTETGPFICEHTGTVAN